VLGPVFRTYDPSRDRLVSVKVFRLDLLPEQAEALAAELQGLAEIDLDDPAIVAPLAAGLEGHTVYLAEEYVAAESLDVALKHYAPAPLDHTLAFLGQLAGAIDFARARGVGHGALHPRDIFVTPELARATGFGIVQALERLGVRAPVRRPYSAPERVTGAAWSTPADVFGLAAVAHELLTGKRPAGTGEVAAIAGRAAESNPERLRNVLTRALAEDPASRYPTAGAFVAALEAAAHGSADDSASVVVPARVEPSDEPPPRSSRGARELAVELDQDAAPIAEVGDLDLRTGDEETTYDLGRIDTSKDETRDTAGKPRPVEQPKAVEQAEVVEEPPAPKRRARARAQAEDARAEERSLFDLAEAGASRPPAARAPDLDAEPAAAEAAEEIEEAPIEEALIEEAEMEEEQIEEVQEAQAAEARPLDEFEEEVAGMGIGTAPGAPLAAAAAGRSRPAILPFAIVAMVALLAGFLAGYGLGSRERGPSAGDAPRTAAPALAASVPTAPAPAPPAPAQQAWSESRVEPPPVPVEPPPAPATGLGTLVADSRPAGARVVLDGKAVGKTPLKLANVKAGAHTVRLELDGYRVWATEITVAGGRDTRVAGSFERIRK